MMASGTTAASRRQPPELQNADEWLPYPIAVPWNKLQELDWERSSNAQREEALISLHLGIIRTLALFALSAYLEHGPRDPKIDKLLRNHILAYPTSTGHWVELCREILRLHVANPKTCVVPELVTFWWRSQKKQSQAALNLGRFLELRNQAAHPGLPRDSRQERLQQGHDALEMVVEQLAFLASYPIYIPVRTSSKDADRLRVSAAVACVGTRLVEETMDLEVKPPLEVGDDLLVTCPERKRVHLRLFPMIVPELGTLDLDDLLFYERNRRASGNPRAVVRLNYVGISSFTRVTVDRRSSTSFILGVFTRRFEHWLSSPPEDVEVASSLVDATFPTMAAQVDEAATSMVGRTSVLQQLEVAAASPSGGTYLVVGGPGIGKTTVMAGAARRLNRVAAAHLISREGGKDNPRLIVRALLSQIHRYLDYRGTIPEDYPSALKAFHETLWDLSRAEERVVLVLDSLDELQRGPDGAVDLALFPSVMPPGIVLLISARPGEVVNSLVALGKVEVIDLGTMATDELEQLAGNWKPATPSKALKQVVRLADGNPLFLRALLLEESRDIPTSLEEALERAISALPEDLAQDGVLALFSASRSGLSKRDLSRSLEISPLRAGKILRLLWPYLRQEGDRFLLFHRRLQEWAQEQVGPDLLADAHGRLCDLLLADSDTGRETAMTDLPFHMMSSGRMSELPDLLDRGFPALVSASRRSPEAAREVLLGGVESCGGADLVRAIRYALTAGLVSRGAQTMARTGVTEALARHGDPAVALSLARCLPDPQERELVLGRVIVQVHRRDPEDGQRLLSELSDEHYRAKVRQWFQDPPEKDQVPADWIDSPFPDRRSMGLAAHSLTTAPGQARGKVWQAAICAMRAGNCFLWVRSLASAVTGLPPEEGARHAREAAVRAFEEPVMELRVPMVIMATRALGMAQLPLEAELLARQLDAPRDVARALAAAWLFQAALESASTIEVESTRENTLADVAEQMTATAPAESLSLAQDLKSQTLRDRVLQAVARTQDGSLACKAAGLIGDHGLAARAFSILARWDDAEARMALIQSRGARAAVLERMAAEAFTQGDHLRKERYRDEADALLGSLDNDTRLDTLRESAAHALADETRALALLSDADKLDSSHIGRFENLLRRARILLARPSGKNVLKAVRFAADHGDAVVEVFPDIVGAISENFGQEYKEAVHLVVESLAAAEDEATAILAAGMGVGPDSRVDSAEVDIPPPLPEATAAAIYNATWRGAVRMEVGPKPEIDRLTRMLQTGPCDGSILDRILDLQLSRGDRRGAVSSLSLWISHLDDKAAKQQALQRAREINPLDPRIGEMNEQLLGEMNEQLMARRMHTFSRGEVGYEEGIYPVSVREFNREEDARDDASVRSTFELHASSHPYWGPRPAINFQRLTKGGSTMAPQNAIPLMRKTLEALGTVHRAGRVFIKLEPSSILLNHTGHIGFLDHNSSVNNLDYMAPEAVAGTEALGASTDIHSLGVIFYKMLAGHFPVSPNASLPSFCIPENAPEIPEGVTGVLMKAMSTDPTDRYQSTDEMLTALNLVLKPPVHSYANEEQANIRQIAWHLNDQMSGEGRNDNSDEFEDCEKKVQSDPIPDNCSNIDRPVAVKDSDFFTFPGRTTLGWIALGVLVVITGLILYYAIT